MPRKIDKSIKCKRCLIRYVSFKGFCKTCYQASYRGGKTHEEKLKERNYVENNEGILTNKKMKSKWVVDLDDFEKVKQYLWTDNGMGYAITKLEGDIKVYLHKILCPQWDIVDHKDRNPFNNKRNNLRDGGDGINGLNKKSKRGASGIRGITKKRNKWQVTFTANKKKIHLGYFNDISSAKDVLVKYAMKNGLEEFYNT